MFRERKACYRRREWAAPRRRTLRADDRRPARPRGMAADAAPRM